MEGARPHALSEAEASYEAHAREWTAWRLRTTGAGLCVCCSRRTGMAVCLFDRWHCEFAACNSQVDAVPAARYRALQL